MKTKDAIVLESLRLFLQEGYESASISKLAQQCHVTKGAVYHHFENKDDIFLHAVKLFYRDLDQWFQNRFTKSKGVKDFLWVFFDYPDYFKQSAIYDNNYHNSYRLIFDTIKRLPQIKKLIIEKYRNYDERIQNIIKKGIHDNVLKTDTDPVAIATEVFVLFEGFMLVDVAFGNEVKLADRRNLVFEALWNRIKA